MEAETGKGQLGWNGSAASMDIQGSKGFSLLKEVFWTEIRPCPADSLRMEQFWLPGSWEFPGGLSIPWTTKGKGGSEFSGCRERRGRPGLGRTGENVGLGVLTSPELPFPTGIAECSDHRISQGRQDPWSAPYDLINPGNPWIIQVGKALQAHPVPPFPTTDPLPRVPHPYGFSSLREWGLHPWEASSRPRQPFPGRNFPKYPTKTSPGTFEAVSSCPKRQNYSLHQEFCGIFLGKAPLA